MPKFISGVHRSFKTPVYAVVLHVSVCVHYLPERRCSHMEILNKRCFSNLYINLPLSLHPLVMTCA